MNNLLPEVQAFVERLELSSISKDRRLVLQALIDYIQNKIDQQAEINLNFICTHNSRRSQLCQVWAKTAAEYYGIRHVNTFSGGTEATAFNANAVEALQGAGLAITKKDQSANPVYYIEIAPYAAPLACFSKLYNDPENPSFYAAVMTCSDAEANCPYIPEADARIAVKYEDPKKSDGTPQQEQIYAERCRQIAMEMFYVFSKIKKS